MRKDLLILESRNNVSRNKKNRTRAALIGSSMAVFLLVGGNNPVVASAEEIPSVEQMSSVVATAEVSEQASFVSEMVWTTEAIPATDTVADSDPDTDMELFWYTNVAGESYPIYSTSFDALNEYYGTEYITDTDVLANNLPLAPDARLNLTGYMTTAASDFTIISGGEEVEITSTFMLYMPNSIVEPGTGDGFYNGGPIFVQSVDESGIPTGAVYEVDESFYYPVDEPGFVGNEFYIPMTVDGVNGFTYFFKGSGVDTISDGAFYGDTDGDGLLDVEETDYYGTDPNKADTDGDGLNDFDEVVVYGTDGTMADTDSDGLNDYDEVIVYNSDPYDPDSDNDGLTDGVEVNQYGTDPNDPDTDGDGIIDGNEAPVGEPTEDGEKPETLAYTGNTSHVGLIAGSIATLLFVVKKVIKL